ncbi:hypothetical protein [Novosphingobium sp. B 225]|nr:hypothetical protein [Novosphingobium sp. B 225]
MLFTVSAALIERASMRLGDLHPKQTLPAEGNTAFCIAGNRSW